MDPFSGLSDQVEMQVKIEQRQAGFVRRHRAGDHALVNGLVFQKDLGRLDPGFIDLSAANLLVAVAQVQPGNGSVSPYRRLPPRLSNMERT